MRPIYAMGIKCGGALAFAFLAAIKIHEGKYIGLSLKDHF
jgi:hypothetical protein